MYITKCGYKFDEENGKEYMFSDKICITVGCQQCEMKTDKIYYKQDMDKGVKEIAKIMLR